MSRQAKNSWLTFLEPRNLRWAWEKVLANQGCGGVDGETVAKFAQRADRHLTTMLHSLADRTYQPLPLRQMFIPKKTGGWRELQIPTVRDRIVQQAVLNVLHPSLEPEFADCSFAYRPGRSHRMAVDRIVAWRHRGYDWVLDADLVDYFPQIQHDRLLAELQERIDLPLELLDLITKFLQAGVLTPEGIVIPRTGLAQGSVISPILANVYLDDFDEAIPKAGVQLVRYADDFLVLAKSQTEIMKTKDRVAEMLESMGLTLHPQKTQIVNFDRGFQFLGHTFVGDLVIPISKRSPTPFKRGLQEKIQSPLF
ncbi:MAG: CRISPR-associated endonuclease Cas1, partial [Coleofasciculaceae cyanobacterium SM2_1_6]|nr:CRISPR-associated endonuclease Cas1 [Coleofasciculaceae cyanobacterium SM2_1_6]